jgi:hypothetical protein
MTYGETVARKYGRDPYAEIPVTIVSWGTGPDRGDERIRLTVVCSDGEVEIVRGSRRVARLIGPPHDATDRMVGWRFADNGEQWTPRRSPVSLADQIDWFLSKYYTMEGER